MMDLLFSVSLVFLGYVITDRVLARVLTGDWLGQPEDIERDTPDVK